MFYLNEISGRIEPYQVGIIRAKRVIEPTASVSAIGDSAIGHHAAYPQSNTAAKPSGVAAPVIAAYEKAIHPDAPRRRVIFASELMCKEIVTINENALLSEAAEIFSRRRFRHIPVVNTQKFLTGILSDRDLLRYSSPRYPSHKGWATNIVKTIMTQPVLVASEDTEIREIAGVMFEERIGCMPITNSEGNLVGIITRSDILRTLVVQAPLELWQ